MTKEPLIKSGSNRLLVKMPCFKAWNARNSRVIAKFHNVQAEHFNQKDVDSRLNQRFPKFLRQTIRPNRYKHISLLTGLILLCAQANAWSDNTGDTAGNVAGNNPGSTPVEKILIDADHMQLNIETGYSVYTGNVKISQGKLVLTGDKVTLEQHNNEIERITVIGKPARYNHVTEKGETIKAESERMVYTASQNKLVMTINASLQQPDNLVSSQKITYDTLKRIVIAGDSNINHSDKNDAGNKTDLKEKQRVNITLTPKKQIQPTKESPAQETLRKK
jgi:lipopolysaccharide transport protein LptA